MFWLWPYFPGFIPPPERKICDGLIVCTASKGEKKKLLERPLGPSKGMRVAEDHRILICRRLVLR